MSVGDRMGSSWFPERGDRMGSIWVPNWGDRMGSSWVPKREDRIASIWVPGVRGSPIIIAICHCYQGFHIVKWLGVWVCLRWARPILVPNHEGKGRFVIRCT